MERKKLILNLMLSFCLVALSMLSAFGQQKLYDLPSDLGDIEICVFDIFENAYVLTSDNVVLKINDKGIEAEYQVPFGYTIDQLGMNHIHKLFLFSIDQQAVIFLDNQLTELNNISFQELGYNNVTSVDLSEEDRLWFIDADRRELIEFPTLNAVLSTSFAIREVNQNLADFVLDQSIDRISITGNNCSYGYSLLGQYLNYFPFDQGTIIDDKGHFYRIKENILWKIERLMPDDLKIKSLNTDSQDWKHMAIKRNSLYYLHNKGCYKMSLLSN